MNRSLTLSFIWINNLENFSPKQSRFGLNVAGWAEKVSEMSAVQRWTQTVELLSSEF